MKRLLFIVGLICVLSSPVWASEAAQEHEESAGLFSGSMAEAVWTLIWFLLVLGVLWLFAWKPILQGLKGREEHIQQQVDDAEEIKKKADDLLDEYRNKLSTVEQEGKSIIAARKKQAENEAQEVIKKTELDIDRMKARAQEEILQTQEQAQSQLKKEAGRMVLKLGSEILGRTMNEHDNEKLIDEAIAKLKD